MQRLFPKVILVGIIVSAVAISFCFTALAAEKKKFVYSKKTQKYLSTIPLHDRTDTKYRIEQFSRLLVITEHNDPDLIGAEETVYGQKDCPASMYKGDTEVSWGYTITRTKNGDCYYVKFQSTYTKLAIMEGEAESKFQIFGGTGKYLDAKGSGICKSKGTVGAETAKCEGEWEY